MRNNHLVLKETSKTNYDTIESTITTGINFSKMKYNISLKYSKNATNGIITNSLKVLSYFASVKSNQSRKKILALGKVQSGKTMFFISTIALAFDNGYDLCILFGGTKNTLLDQNISRLEKEFDNNENVIIINQKNATKETIINYIELGKKIIIVSLKNVSSRKSNLYSVEKLSNEISHIPTIIVDDESDEHTPGAPKTNSKNKKVGITHEIVSSIIRNFNNVTTLFVTATPQANLLLSTIDELSPDHICLVEPGHGYVGGSLIHDVIDNENIEIIDDKDDFLSSTPDSFRRAIMFFMLSTTYKRIIDKDLDYSMLVHPSSLNIVQKNIVEKTRETIEHIKQQIVNVNDISYIKFRESIKNEYLEAGFNVDFEAIINSLEDNIEEYKVYEFNNTRSGKQDIELLNYENDYVKHKIFIGGNMLGRGLTIPNLSVTYIYRDSKQTAIDTLYQRARWLGYKQNYIDIIKVYITRDLAEKFIATVDSENDMWDTINEFLKSQMDLKKLKRVFSLNHEKLMLTRKSVSKTVTIERVKSGYNYDRSLMFKNVEEINSNNILINEMIKNEKFKDVSFANNDTQNHLVLKGKFTDLYDKYISKFNLPRNSKIGDLSLKRIYDQASNKEIEDNINILIMRYKTGQFRTSKYGYEILELPQGYNISSNYPGDKNLPGFEGEIQFQFHLVYTDKTKNKDYIPLLAVNNPLSNFTIRYVTGDDFYE